MKLPQFLADEAETNCEHKRIVPIDADWARCEDCGDASFPISASAAGYEPEGMTEAEKEVERCHAALDRIYRYLAALEPSLTSVEQANLCITDACKWRKHPTWEERYEYLQTAEGKRDEERQFKARKKAISRFYGDVVIAERVLQMATPDELRAAVRDQGKTIKALEKTIKTLEKTIKTLERTAQPGA